MTPVLLDQNSLLIAGVTAALVVTGVFVSGYTIGYRSAESGTGVDLNKTMVLALPKPAHADLSEFEPVTPQVQIPGAEIDADRPDSVVETNEQAPDTAVIQAEGQLAAVITETTNSIEAPALTGTPAGRTIRGYSEQHPAIPADVAQATAVDAIQVPNEAGHTARRAQDIDATTLAATIRAPDSGTRILDNADADEARYTIQVGVFSNTDNAVRRKTELESHQLSAYINEYRNKSNQPRFNVRFGYFKDKSSASAALSRFEQDLAGSGYVTRIRRH